MKDSMHSSGSQRRGFLKSIAWFSGAVALVLRGGRSFAEEPKAECKAEIDKLKKDLLEKEFEDLRNKARYIRRLREKLGPSVIEETRKLTIENSEKYMKNADIPKSERNLAHVKKDYLGVGEAVSYTWAEDTPQRLKAKVTRCRFAEELKKDGNDGELGFALACAGDIGYCAGLNPDMKFTRTKTIMMGDDHCDHTYELKA